MNDFIYIIQRYFDPLMSNSNIILVGLVFEEEEAISIAEGIDNYYSPSVHRVPLNIFEGPDGTNLANRESEIYGYRKAADGGWRCGRILNGVAV